MSAVKNSSKAWLAAAKTGTVAQLQAIYEAVSSTDERSKLCQLRDPGVSSAGHSALHWAAARGLADMLHWLVGLGQTDLNLRNNGGSVALHSASANNCAEAVRILCDAGADAAAKDANGETPFDIAAARNYAEVASSLLATHGAHLPRSHAFLQISVSGHLVGTLIFDLFDDLAPRACANFLGLCEGIGGRCYRGTRFHRLLHEQIIQGGRLGQDSSSIFGGMFADERPGLARAHDARGLLCLANSGADSNGSQFYVTLRPTPHLDGRHVVFGRLVCGDAVLAAVEGVGVGDEAKPVLPVVVNDSGKWPPPSASKEGVSRVTESAVTLGDVGSVSARTCDGVESAVRDALRNSLKRPSEAVAGCDCSDGTAGRKSQKRELAAVDLSRWDVLEGMGSAADSDDDSVSAEDAS